ncbi:serine/arginine repetitive matrix protein 1 isoform X2 [Sitodiplosis mosellana]|uniref:serine/arginine repetitive matrix protein 1 isoform X2 n=1 Tax=Sitodiplosis mosellana TaxID=263140 RepID=UPI002443D1A0|nr:serine/arginine repetitive matrix protein 1 isoform X2 [Sitodiplosis mosellana]XP_055307545.1 serine/arginine repetitive matrix protein 1 isoform X2 [Sitodiplosis mosellana]XP_055307546.1 serine/arginine repetitive matrix protein 1 isoform X2 [Sitodiplosis mosellana]XP_055307547.1 serine/arginine repetitive matrix protein 1 isoform X2 [Sitodiplosis mosellana]XP_055307548.1 serine/arginine repetitive matrix protein 1 isoform X2 [Sitodiplosis mosellana]
MSSSNRRRVASPPRGGVGKLRMDRQRIPERISDPSLPMGRRKEIDNVMKKARANTNDYWDKKLLEVEEKDPNRWRHTGYKKMYIEGESSSESDRESFRYSRGSLNRNRCSRSRSRTRKSPPMSPLSKRTQSDLRRRSPQSPNQRNIRRTPESKRASNEIRRRSPVAVSRSPSNSSVSCTDDSCSVCSPKSKRLRSRSASRTRHVPGRSTSNSHLRHMPLSPSQNSGKINGRNGPSFSSSSSSMILASGHHSKQRPPSPMTRDERRTHDDKWKIANSDKLLRDRVATSRGQALDESTHDPSLSKHSLSSRLSKNHRTTSLDYVRLKNPTELSLSKKKSKDSTLRAKVKIEGEKHKHNKETEREKESSDSDESSSSESSFPKFAATTRLTLSERFGKMAQWSVDRSNMENMRITKSSGGALKVMIEEGIESPQAGQRRYSYSPAPQGHFPEELATTAPTGLMSWDDVRVRYEYYKSRGYLRDLDLKDYVKWEDWWYKYQSWLKQERYYEFYERQQMSRRRRKKIPITQRLN